MRPRFGLQVLRNSTPARALGILLALFLTPVFGETLTLEERQAIWAAALGQLKEHPRLVWHDGRTGFGFYPGFIISNEMAHWTANPPTRGNAHLQVGFGSIVGLSLAARRKSKVLVMADQSAETVVSLMSFWRPLFLACETPGEFVASLGGYEYVPGTDPQYYFDLFRARRSGTAKGMKDLDRKLEALERAGKISSLDRRFTMTVVAEQQHCRESRGGNPEEAWREEHPRKTRTPDRHFLFIEAWKSLGILDQLAELYSLPEQESYFAGHEQFLKSLRRLLIQTSFLGNAGYKHVRGIFERRDDYYAQARIEDEGFWRALGALATRNQWLLTDVYTSNILTLLRDRMREDEAFLFDVALVPSEEVVIYEAMWDPPHRMATRVVRRNPDGQTGMLVRRPLLPLRPGARRSAACPEMIAFPQS